MAALSEGDVFVVPLRDGSEVLGLISRLKRGGRGVLAYLFGPRISHGEYEEALEIVLARNVIDVVDVASDELKKGRWPIVTRVPNWVSSDWPVPIFRYRSGQLSIRSQDEYDLEIRCDLPNSTSSSYRYSVYGSDALKIELESRLIENEIRR